MLCRKYLFLVLVKVVEILKVSKDLCALGSRFVSRLVVVYIDGIASTLLTRYN